MKYAMRSLRKNPGFSIAMVLTLTLGVGANSAIFSLVYAALLRPLPLFQAGRLAFVSTENRKNNIFGSGVSGREYEEWQPQLHRIFARGVLSSALIGRYGGRFGSPCGQLREVQVLPLLAGNSRRVLLAVKMIDVSFGSN